MMSKICFICSSGGHYSELSKLMDISNEFDSFLITESKEQNNSFRFSKNYHIHRINRKEIFFLIHFLFLTLREFYIFLKEKPDVIITTGALCAFPLCKIAKIYKKKIIYIESFARVEDLSLTGKKIYNIADLFIVQWPELVKKYPKAIYSGNLFGDF